MRVKYDFDTPAQERAEGIKRRTEVISLAKAQSHNRIWHVSSYINISNVILYATSATDIILDIFRCLQSKTAYILIK